MPTIRECAECGTPLPEDIPQGACPVCALRGALDLTDATPELAVTEKAGDRIGRYKLLENIGEGGYGIVYMAEQAEPIRRRVALKIVKLGMDTKQVIARFEAERQALALMDHPNIAKVLDAGATDTGRPYFVMELVRGIRMTDYCNQHHLSTKERLDLFIQVCQAVQHAHQKGIIHRDLKPSNILITQLDGVPVPKVIDFGIAKATSQQRLTDKTLFTAFQQFIGTPAYMSPEQAEMSGVDVDTRSDIYSLGVLLYELLTGHTPFEARELVQAGFDEMRRLIREKEPTRPSTRLRTLAAKDLTTVARHQRTEPPKLVHLVRGDLDWIVMKCLEKDRGRRYATANDLARDVERHLVSEPVMAAAPGPLYRMGKFVRRNRLVVGLLAVVFILHVVIAWLSLYMSYRLNKSGKAQEVALREAVLRRGEATGALQRLEKETAAKDAALTEARQQRDSADTQKKIAEEQNAAAQAASQRAELNLKVAASAQAAALTALEVASNETANAKAAQAESLRQQAKVEDFVGFMLFDLSDKLRPLGQADLLRDVTMKVSAHYQALTNRDDSEHALSRRYAAFKNLGYTLAVQGDTANAERYYRAGLQLVEELSARGGGGTNWQAEQCACHARIGEILQTRGDSAGALDQFKQSLSIAKGLVARQPKSPAGQEWLLAGYLKFGDVVWTQGDKDGALRNYQAALTIARDAAQSDPHNTANRHDLALSYSKIGSFYLREGDANEAMLACSNSLAVARQLADENPGISEWQADLASSLDSLGDVCLARQKPDEAQAEYSQALEIRQRLANAFPANAFWQQALLGSHLKVYGVLSNEGKRSRIGAMVHDSLKVVQGSYSKATDILQRLFSEDPRDKATLNDCSNLVTRVEQFATRYAGNMEWQHDLARSHSLYGDMLLAHGATEAALQHYERALRIREQLAKDDPNATGNQYWLDLSHVNRAAALRRLHRPEEASEEARQALLIFADLMSRWPRNAVFLEGPHLRKQNLSVRILVVPDQLDDAVAAFKDGYRKARALAAKEPANLVAQVEWGKCCSARAAGHLIEGEIASSIAESEKALKVWQQISQAAPTDSFYRDQLRRAYVSLAVFQFADRRYQAAIKTAGDGLNLEPELFQLEAVRALAFFCGHQEEEGLEILLRNRDLQVGLNQTFPEAVLDDLRRLQGTQLDVEQIQQRLATAMHGTSQ